MNCTKFENYVNTPKNEDFAADDSAAFDVPFAEYEDEIDTTKKVMAKILGVQQPCKALSCNGCTRKILEIVSSNKVVFRLYFILL